MEQDHKPDHEWAAIVNLEAKALPAKAATFDEIVRLAYPHKADDPNITFQVTYRKAEAPKHEGIMIEGDIVEVKEDGATSFTVVHATKS